MDEKSDKVHEKLLSLEKDVAKLSHELQAKTRALEIESALEVVRGRTMAMQYSNELKEVIQVVHDQLVNIGIYTEHAGFILNYKENDKMHIWLADKNTVTNEILIPYFDSPHWNSFKEAKAQGKSFFANQLTFEEKNKFYTDLFKVVSELPDDLLDTYLAYKGLSISTVLLDNIGLYIENFEGKPYSQEENNILMCFGKVFQQTYTRFLDLQKAEAQTREAEIELALERIRARSMAMYRSEELVEVATVLHNELRSLNVREFSETSIVVHDEPNQELIVWGALTGSGSLEKAVFPLLGDQALQKLYDTWRNKEEFFTLKIEGETLRKHIDFVFPKATRTAIENEAIKSMPDPTFFHCAFFCMGYLELMADKELSQDSSSLLVRFARVFDQAYIRFLDLQKAEAQAREAQIEAALERLRAASMAMHHSEELSSTSLVMFQEIVKLGIRPWNFAFFIFHGQSDIADCFSSDQTGSYQTMVLPHKPDQFLRKTYEDWRANKTLTVQEAKGRALKKHQEYMKTIPGFDQIVEQRRKAGIKTLKKMIFNNAHFKYGYIMINTLEPQTDFLDILQRIASVFEQTYTRFLDLQKAEAQAREAQIEAALERVRAASMAMHRSEELIKVVRILDNEIKGLGIQNIDITQIVTDFVKPKEGTNVWLAIEGRDILDKYHVPYKHNYDHPSSIKFIDAVQAGEHFYTEKLSKAEKNRYIKMLFKHSDFKNTPKERQSFLLKTSGLIKSVVINKNSALIFYHYGLNEYSEEDNAIFRRCGGVFEQAYTRFLDLKKAESQAREARIEVALERVRASTMAMHASKDLHKVAEELRRQIGQLDYKDLETCAIHLYDESPDYFVSWAAQQSPDSESDILNSHIHFPKSGVEIFEEMMEGYNSGKKDYVIVNEGKKMVAFLKMLEHSAPAAHQVVNNTIKDFKPKDVRSFWTFSDFAGGSLAMVTLTRPDDPTRELLSRFANVFGLSYQRFKDLKQAEAQTKEAQIELGLERVRARTMAMQNSEELREVASVLYEQMNHLQLGNLGSNLVIFNEEKNYFEIWVSNDRYKVFEQSFFFRNQDHPAVAKYWSIWKSQEPGLIELEGSDKIDYDNYVFNQTDFKLFPEEEKQNIREMDNAYFSCVPFSYGLLVMIDNVEPLSTHGVQIIGRFAKVFDQTYTRFLDLQKAEAQAREAQIEVALERVRSRTMAMHKSDELSEVAALLFKQLKMLGAELWTAVIAFCKEDELLVEKWGGSPITDQIFDPTFIPYNADHGEQLMYDTWKNKVELYSYIQDGKELKEIYDHLMTIPSFKASYQKVIDAGRPLPVWQKNHVVSYKYGYLLIVTENEFEEEYIFPRFAKVFEQTYTRFLDLQKAEEQAREAQIELALERVRSRSMAMHKSKELSEIVALMFEETKAFGFATSGCELILIDEKNDHLQFWLASPVQNMILECFNIPRSTHLLFQKQWKAWEDQIPRLTITLEGQEKKEFNQLILGKTDYKRLPEEVKEFILNSGNVDVFSHVIFKHGLLEVVDTSPLSEEMFTILHRFAKVFEQTYTRFLDLKKAEAQAREAQIEAALERLRAASMAMHRSEELTSTSLVMFQELIELGIQPWNFAFFIFHGQSDIADCFASDQTGFLPTMVLPHKPDQFLRKIYEDWRANKALTVLEAKGKALKKHQEYMKTIPGYDGIIKQRRTAGVKTLKKMIFNNAHFKYGYIMINTLEPQTDFWDILQRIAKVFEQTYTRFLDLKKAEVQVREAQIEAALERVRSKSMAMRKSEELADLSYELVKQVQGLGVATWFCAFNIYDDDEKGSLEWGSNAEGTYERYRTPREGIFLRYFEAGQRGDEFLVNEIGEDECPAHYEYLSSLPGVGEQLLQMKDAGIPFPTSQVDHVAFFKYGYVIFITFDPEPESHDIFKRFAKVFEQTYTRFLDLQKAEVQAAIAKKQSEEIELAYDNLKATQTQLIHAEKMASLGEVTAGIAHEIQNPLNFVNNFSDVSVELIDEAFEELEQNDFEMAKEVLNDLKGNLEKIAHHGGRASNIVKGMLDHSRASTGEKVPTDINAICDEYLRLAYHGLRAKDNTFNSKMETDFDESIGNINVVAQDISRVILNLVTNAFQACRADGLVKISTKKLEDKIEVSVQDNGSGIPDAIKDKIFQPFFTTKDTGKGTGLGLSLAYDIVKAHGGELRVETKDGEGSVFKILLPI